MVAEDCSDSALPLAYSSSSSSSSSFSTHRTVTIGADGLMPGEELAMRVWLVQQGFEPGDLHSEKSINYRMMTPMEHACWKDELNVCKWLHNHGEGEDVNKADNWGWTPMLLACHEGHLSVCEWLIFNGAMNRPMPTTADEGDGTNNGGGHVDQAIVERNITHYMYERDLRISPKMNSEQQVPGPWPRLLISFEPHI